MLVSLCDHLNEALGEEIRFLPGSAEGELPTACGAVPVGWIRLLPETVVVHTYVDGTRRYEIPFGVYVRIDGNSPAEHTTVLDRFCRITEVLENYATWTAHCRLAKLPGIEKMERGSAVVYRAGYCLSSFGKGDKI